VKYVLDTNVISALMYGHPAATARLAAVSRADVRLPQPALAEIAYGIARLPKSKRRTWLDERRALIIGVIQRADWTDEVSTAFGRIKAALEKRGEPIDDFDAAVAAHALAAGAVLVTADRQHMTRVPGVAVEDWSQ
jgi:tRNA(fMet)-specific endonuclease VapC